LLSNRAFGLVKLIIFLLFNANGGSRLSLTKTPFFFSLDESSSLDLFTLEFSFVLFGNVSLVKIFVLELLSILLEILSSDSKMFDDLQSGFDSSSKIKKN